MTYDEWTEKIDKKSSEIKENFESEYQQMQMDKILYVLENNDYGVNYYKNENKIGFELEAYTSNGVNMIHYLDIPNDEQLLENFSDKFKDVVNDFDVDETIDSIYFYNEMNDPELIASSIEDFEAYEVKLEGAYVDLIVASDEWEQFLEEQPGFPEYWNYEDELDL
ncbi:MULTISPECIES: hypothetical protein [Aerococcus]|uniref:hypothetical protein n=1 Tax=Aerococcus TaxID=1375 RepID=UPI0018A744E9|nr:MULTISPECIES: hypothetical protein [Aerococcus]MCY3067588.1 hypothetical protein [Aerococcus mictus]MCY3080877.1 hypothetical protein [Aerococcus mictus]MDK8485482.1 hypothetical protein [Aerococcus urinae]